MPNTTPLLLLLDGILSQAQDRIDSSLQQIHALLGFEVPLPRPEQSVARSVSNLCAVIDALLRARPDLASIPSQRDGSLPLHFCASLGSVPVASILWHSYPRAAYLKNANKKLPLHYAAREGRTQMVEFLLQQQPDTAAICTQKTKLPLHFAAGDGHVAIVDALLRVHPQGASLPSKKGKIPLHFAARWGHIEIAKQLLRIYPQGVSALDWEGSLPLHDAAREGQVEMSRYLLKLYPQGLWTANLRGEIPLFAAVRSKQVDLVKLFLQAWPQGAMQILQCVSADDKSMLQWDLVELLLRGAVNQLKDVDSAVFQRKPPPHVQWTQDVQGPSSTSSLTLEGSKPQDDTKSNKLDKIMVGEDRPNQLPMIASRQETKKPAVAAPRSQPVHDDDDSKPAALALPSKPTRTTTTLSRPPRITRGASGEMVIAVPRSKSPILEANANRKKRSLSSTTSEAQKRMRLKSTGDEDGESFLRHAEAPSAPDRRQRTFIALHAALECGASHHVLEYVLDQCPNQVQELDDVGRLPLHLAVASSKCRHEAFCSVIVDKLLKPYPVAASRRDLTNGRLPLHTAISSRAHICLISALLEAFAHAAACCSNNDQSPPLYMACHHDCDLSTVYALLRVDPSVIYSKKLSNTNITITL